MVLLLCKDAGFFEISPRKNFLSSLDNFVTFGRHREIKVIFRDGDGDNGITEYRNPLGMYILYFAVCSIFLPVPRSMYINSIEKLRNIIDDPAWRKKAELNGIDSDTIFVLSSDLYDLQFKMDQAKK